MELMNEQNKNPYREIKLYKKWKFKNSKVQ